MAQRLTRTTNTRKAAWACLAILAWAGLIVMFPAFGATGLSLQGLGCAAGLVGHVAGSTLGLLHRTFADGRRAIACVMLVLLHRALPY